MMDKVQLFSFSVNIIILIAGHAQGQGPQITLPGPSNTDLRGTYITFNESEYLNVDITIEAFLGIPYAEPPVGDLRFRNPVKKGDLGMLYLADRDRSTCAQVNGGENEDCLYLGVHTSSPRPRNASVMVWLHGGAFTLGGGSWTGYDPYPLIAISPDIIVVNINYRLGVLGFLTTGDDASFGNFGMHDQVMALQWVQENIAAFGGDPRRVTIMGESAGAASVGLHLLSPLSQGLFRHAIMESGNALCPWAVDTNITRQVGFTKDIADRVNCSTTDNEDLVECLRNTDVIVLLRVQALLVGQNLFNELLFVPVVDGSFLPDIPIDMIKREEFHKVPTLLGTNEDEGTLIALRAYPIYLRRTDPPTMTIQEFRESLPNYLYYYTPMLASAVEQWYIDWSLADNSSADQLEAFVRLNTDQVFSCSTEIMARALEGCQAIIYRYEMTHDPSRSIWGDKPGWMRAGHGEEIQYVFGWGIKSRLNQPQTHEEKLMSIQVMRYWTNFIQNGDPNDPAPTNDLPFWPRYTIPDQEYKKLSQSMDNGRAMRMDSCSFWMNYAPTLYNQDNNPEDLYQEWKEDYEHWRDVDMVEWNEVFNDYVNDCNAP
nr:cholinesterase-like [Lytechinus pictus]